MLYQQWLQVLDKYSDRTAISCPVTPEGRSFGQLHERAEQISQNTDEIYYAVATETDFLPTIIAAWKAEKPVILLENPKSKIRDIRGEIPAGTSLIKQACGASGLERSLFFSEEQVYAEFRLNLDNLSLTPHSRGLAVISLAHSYGLGCLTLPLLLAGIPVEIVASPFPAFISECLKKPGMVFLPAVPALWKIWLETNVIEADKISLALSAGSPLSLELEHSVFQSSNLKIHNFYGTSETGAIAYDSTLQPRADQSLLGKVLANVSVSIDSQKRICVQTPARATSSDRPLSEEEFSTPELQTMDIGELDGDLLHWLGFEGNAINVAGRKLSPERIRRHCLAIPSVAAVEIQKFTSQDLERFEEAKVIASLTDGMTLRQLKRKLSETLDGWEIPRLWEEAQ